MKRTAAAFLAFLLLALPVVALAQDAGSAAAVVDASSIDAGVSAVVAAPAPAASPVTILGMVLNAIYAALAAVVAWGGLALGRLLSQKANQSAAWSLVNRLWVKAQMTVNTAEAKLRPDIQKALADGSLNADESKELAAKAMVIFKELAAAEIAELPKVMGIVGESAMGTFLTGMLEHAVSGMSAGGPPTPVPGATNPAVPS